MKRVVTIAPFMPVAVIACVVFLTGCGGGGSGVSKTGGNAPYLYVLNSVGSSHLDVVSPSAKLNSIQLTASTSRVVLDSTNEIFAVVTGQRTLQKYSAAGTLLWTSNPVSQVIQSVNLLPNGNVVVGHSGGFATIDATSGSVIQDKMADEFSGIYQCAVSNTNNKLYALGEYDGNGYFGSKVCRFTIDGNSITFDAQIVAGNTWTANSSAITGIALVNNAGADEVLVTDSLDNVIVRYDGSGTVLSPSISFSTGGVELTGPITVEQMTNGDQVLFAKVGSSATARVVRAVFSGGAFTTKDTYATPFYQLDGAGSIQDLAVP